MPVQQSYQPVCKLIRIKFSIKYIHFFVDYQPAMYQPTSQTPVFFQTSPQPPMIESSNYVNDSTADAQPANNGTGFGSTFAPAGYTSFIYQQPGPIYYPQTPLIQTPLASQTGMAPVFPTIHATPIVSPTSTTTQHEVVSNDSGNHNTDTSVAANVSSEL